MKSGPLLREEGRQVAALCWRPSARPGAVVDVLLITSRNSRRWILPKGWPEPDFTLADNAAREAFEEAGVVGRIDPDAIGHYAYLKARKEGGAMALSVEVFALAVIEQLDNWPEKGMRASAWLPMEQAVIRIAEPGLRQVMRDFLKQQMPANASPVVRQRG